jgi:hypothetical protein
MHLLTGLRGVIVVNRNLSLLGDESNNSGHAYRIANIRHMMQIPLQASSFPATNFQGGQQ